MSGMSVLERFLGASTLLDRMARESFELLPLGLRYRLHYGKTFLRWLAFLRESEFWPQERIEMFQFEQLRELLVHAGRNVPFYRELFQERGFDPARMESPEDIGRIPYLTKEILRDRSSDLIAENISPSDLIRTTTGGSTGIPVTIHKTKESMAINQAFLIDLLRRVDYSPKKRIAFFQWRDIRRGRKSVDVLRYGNKLILSATHTADERLERYYHLIRDFRPHFISGYKTVLLSLAVFIRDRGLHPLEGIRAALSYAETVYPWQREVIEASFQTRVFSSYGQFEGVVFGGECEHTTQYHFYPQKGQTEFLRIDEGRVEIVGTGFQNRAMPLVRYRTNDLATLGERQCSMCRRGFPIVHTIEGRLGEFLVDRNGKVHYTAMVGIATDVFRNVKQFQFRQEEPGIVHLRIVRGTGYSEEDTGRIMAEMHRLFNIPEFALDIEMFFEDAIGTTPSGKVLMTDQHLQLKDFSCG